MTKMAAQTMFASAAATLSLLLLLGCREGGCHDDTAGADPPVPKYCQYTLNLAAKGYDVVAYFGLDVAQNGTLGRADTALTFNNATFRFATAANRAAFRAAPWKYHPAFGGFCAFGMAKFPSTLGQLRLAPPVGPPICPLTQWTLHNGTLYLNDCDTRDQWLAHRDEYIAGAERLWASYFGAQHAGPTNIDCFGP